MKTPDKINWTKIEAYTNQPEYKLLQAVIARIEKTFKKPEQGL